MFDRWAAEFARTHTHPACDNGKHGGCPHLMYGGFGFDPRVLRVKAGGAGLCTCDCHSDCPVTSHWQDITVRLWREACTCPGAEAERRSHDEFGAPPDLDEMRAKQRERSELRKAAFNAVKADAAGKTREELKAMYIAELRSRNLDIPEDFVLHAIVEGLAGNYGPAYLGVAETMGRAATTLKQIFDDFRH